MFNGLVKPTFISESDSVLTYHQEWYEDHFRHSKRSILLSLQIVREKKRTVISQCMTSHLLLLLILLSLTEFPMPS